LLESKAAGGNWCDAAARCGYHSFSQSAPASKFGDFRGDLTQGRLAEAESRLREAEVIFQKLGDRSSLAGIWHNLASVMVNRGDFAQAQMLLEKSLAKKEALGDKAGAAASLSNHSKSLTPRMQPC
jgi:uncharacterized protein HemY